MDDPSDMYEQFPFGEALDKLSSEKVKCLIDALKGDSDDCDDVYVEEYVVKAQDLANYQRLETRLEAFSPMVGVHEVLVESNRVPDYLRDTIAASIKAIRDSQDMTLRAQSSILQDVEINEYVKNMWSTAEFDRLSGNEVMLYRTDVANGGVACIMLVKIKSGVWTLGMHYSEGRTYERLATGDLYRVIGRNIFTDPVGSEGDIANIEDGLYLPCMLKLPNRTTSVTV